MQNTTPLLEGSPIQRLARLAPTLKEGELRVALELASLAEKSPDQVKISSRQLSKRTGLAASFLLYAVLTRWPTWPVSRLRTNSSRSSSSTPYATSASASSRPAASTAGCRATSPR